MEPDSNNALCAEIERLEAVNAELLEIVEQLVFRFPDLGELIQRAPGERNHARELIDNARAAIAKAKGQ